MNTDPVRIIKSSASWKEAELLFGTELKLSFGNHLMKWLTEQKLAGLLTPLPQPKGWQLLSIEIPAISIAGLPMKNINFVFGVDFGIDRRTLYIRPSILAQRMKHRVVLHPHADWNGQIDFSPTELQISEAMGLSHLNHKPKPIAEIDWVQLVRFVVRMASVYSPEDAANPLDDTTAYIAVKRASGEYDATRVAIIRTGEFAIRV